MLYFSHSRGDYRSERAAAARAQLAARFGGEELRDPSSRLWPAGPGAYRRALQGCRGVAVLERPGGHITRGVMEEVFAALTAGLPVWVVRGGELQAVRGYQVGRPCLARSAAAWLLPYVQEPVVERLVSRLRPSHTTICGTPPWCAYVEFHWTDSREFPGFAVSYTWADPPPFAFVVMHSVLWDGIRGEWGPFPYYYATALPGDHWVEIPPGPLTEPKSVMLVRFWGETGTFIDNPPMEFPDKGECMLEVRVICNAGAP